VPNGYDPTQVDRQLTDLSGRLGAVDEQRLDMSRRFATERRRAEQIEIELREARAALQEAQRGGQDAEKGTGFGYRAERILRMADAEAKDMRSTAARDAAALLERTHAEAEAHRHDVEQALISRSAGLDREAAERAAALDAREAKLAEDVEAAAQEVAHLRETARREVAELRQEAQAAIERAAADAEKQASRRREAAAAELDRLTALQDGMREQLARLHQVLTAALPAEPEPATVQSTEQATEQAEQPEQPEQPTEEPAEQPVPASR
jgi:hypothetical protein